MKNKPQDPSPAFSERWRQFGLLLRDRRNSAGLTRLALARKAKVSDATVKFIETARTRPSRATLIRLIEVAELRLTWAEVPGRHEPPQKQNAPALPPPAPPPERVAPIPDPAQFLMNLIGFDEISLPQGVPKSLRVFQKRHRPGKKEGDQGKKCGR